MATIGSKRLDGGAFAVVGGAEGGGFGAEGVDAELVDFAVEGGGGLEGGGGGRFVFFGGAGDPLFGRGGAGGGDGGEGAGGLGDQFGPVAEEDEVVAGLN